MDKPTREQFRRYLRDALNHLREPNYLRASPLAPLLGVANRPDTPARLRRILIDAVKLLKPEADEPAQSPAWRLYESLFFRYVQYSSQLEVANQLGISTRQLRREQQAALQTLAHQLWGEYGVEGRLGEAQEEGSDTPGPNHSVYEDLAWLKDAPPSPTDLQRELPATLDLIRPLAARRGVSWQLAAEAPLPLVATHPVALRQTLLSLLGVAVACSPAGSAVQIAVRSQGSEVGVEVRAEMPPSAPEPEANGTAASLDMARRLVDLCGGRLALAAGDGAFSATLILPALGQLPVLVIDDNAGTLNLLQRYTAGTRYRLVGTQDAQQALSLAAQHAPQIIVLDVMMPEVDGWAVLGQLRQHPLTSHVPIVVCTILAQEELALSLGASAYVRKPVTRQAFLAALDRQVAPAETEPR